MSLSLYDISVPNYLQMLGSTLAILAKTSEHAEQSGVDLDKLLAAKLHPGMLPLRFQLVSVVHHSLGAIEGMKQGLFMPPSAMMLDASYEDMQILLNDASKQIESITKDEINALSGKAMLFKMGDFELSFTTEDFMQSFSLPNFYFHVTTTYDILRMEGVSLGKLDFLGKIRTS
ncbi:MAG: DUF1993 domain-containing protein [Pseudomonadales bacterium]|nr:DUF1993 domain-containing protein [Pseudomonadales bacterium]